MNNSQLPKGYKLTEVGVIPEDWRVEKVGEVCDFIVPGRNKPKLFDGDIPWITTPDLEEGKPVTVSRFGLCISRKEAKFVGSKIVPSGSVLMSCAGELGIVALTQNEMVVNQQLHVFIPTECIEKIFLLNVLAYQKDEIASYGTKTAVPYLNKSSCNSILIPVPPLPEQRSIATALSDMDELLGGLDRLLAKKRDLKQAAMQQLLTGKKRLSGFGEGKGYKQTKFGLIPEDWEVTNIGELTIKVGSGITPTGGNRVYKQEGRPFIRSQNVGWGCLLLDDIAFIDEETHSRFPETEIKINDVFLNITGASIGRSSVADFRVEGGNVNQHVCIIRTNECLLVPHYLNLILLSSLGQKQIDNFQAGGNRQGLNFSQVRSIFIPLPHPPEQTAIASILSDMDTEIAAIEQRRNKTRDLKQAMMQELLTGRIRLA